MPAKALKEIYARCGSLPPDVARRWVWLANYLLRLTIRRSPHELLFKRHSACWIVEMILSLAVSKLPTATEQLQKTANL